MTQLALRYEDDAPVRSISPVTEMGAYEALWLEPGATFRRLAERFRRYPTALPSDFVPRDKATATGQLVLDRMRAAGVGRFGLRIHGAGEYPPRLRDARNPVELLYYQGWWNLVESPCVAVVGTRRPTDAGKQSAKTLVERLVAEHWTIVSGLAEGIDTVAHRTAMAVDGRTIAVLGTTLSAAYPRENSELQIEIARDFLVVSQVPVLRYAAMSWKERRVFFPERNATMSALTDATVIVEAGNTSGTLHQARAALFQRRKLFILDSCFQTPGLTWPHRFEKLGAIRVRDFEALDLILGQPNKT
jgi:DNA processing protein